MLSVKWIYPPHNFLLCARWNKTMSWSTEAQVRGWGMLFTKKTTVLKHLLKPCSDTALAAEMLLYDGHLAEYQEKSNAHSLVQDTLGQDCCKHPQNSHSGSSCPLRALQHSPTPTTELFTQSMELPGQTQGFEPASRRKCKTHQTISQPWL